MGIKNTIINTTLPHDSARRPVHSFARADRLLGAVNGAMMHDDAASASHTMKKPSHAVLWRSSHRAVTFSCASAATAAVSHGVVFTPFIVSHTPRNLAMPVPGLQLHGARNGHAAAAAATYAETNTAAMTTYTHADI